MMQKWQTDIKPKHLLLQLAFWLLVWVFFRYFFAFNSENKAYIIWFSSILMPITIINVYFFNYYLIPTYLFAKKHRLFALYSIYTIIGTAYLLSIVMFIGYVYMSELDFKRMPPLSASLPIILLSIYVVVIVAASFKLLKHHYLSIEKHKDLQNKFLQTQLQLKDEELKFLKMQIQPHFLFNTLNTLYGFAMKKADETPEMILKLSNLLDYILYQIDKPKVFLSEEINHIEDYVSLEKMRFHDSLSVQINKDIKVSNMQLAPMLLLPFVENSFKHGNLINGILTIDILIKNDGDQLVFNINNSFIEKNTPQKGIGLENIQKRLEMLYAGNYQLEIKQENNQFMVQLKLKIK